MLAPMLALLRHPLGPLFSLALITLATVGGYCWFGHIPPNDVSTVLGLAWTILLLMWMEADARQRRQVPCFDFGFLAYLAFPLSVAWYCLWSRGWRGLLVLLGLVCLVSMPFIVASTIYRTRWQHVPVVATVTHDTSPPAGAR